MYSENGFFLRCPGNQPYIVLPVSYEKSGGFVIITAILIKKEIRVQGKLLFLKIGGPVIDDTAPRVASAFRGAVSTADPVFIHGDHLALSQILIQAGPLTDRHLSSVLQRKGSKIHLGYRHPADSRCLTACVINSVGNGLLFVQGKTELIYRCGVSAADRHTSR